MRAGFTCPHCGARTTAPDQSTDPASRCGSCGQVIGNSDIPSQGFPPIRQGSGCSPTGCAIAICLAFAIPLLLFAVMSPLVKKAKMAARRLQCANHMKQIGLALLNYENDHGRFPPPYTVDKDGNRLHSWRVLILPYLEEQALYEKIHLDEPWDSPHNRQFAETVLPIYQCPSNPAAAERTTTDYLMVTGPGTVGDGLNGTKVRAITDGRDKTLLVVESAHSRINWMEPFDFDVATMPLEIVDPDARVAVPAISAHHREGISVAFADGHVGLIPDDTDPEVLKALFTKAGGEEVELPRP